MGDVARGIDPAAERKKARAHEALSLAALLSDWHALHLAGKRPRYASEAVRALRNAFSRYLDLPNLSRATAVKTLDAMARKGSVSMAARTAAYGNAAYGWAVKRGAIEGNPFLNLPVAPTLKRERVLTDDEIAGIWRATDGAGPFNGIVRLLLLTGQRREEVAGMTWAPSSTGFCPMVGEGRLDQVGDDFLRDSCAAGSCADAGPHRQARTRSRNAA